MQKPPRFADLKKCVFEKAKESINPSQLEQYEVHLSSMPDDEDEVVTQFVSGTEAIC